MELTAQQRLMVHNALLDAFRSRSDLTLLASNHLGVNLNEIAGTGSLREVIHALIQWAESRDRIADLLEAAVEIEASRVKDSDVIELELRPRDSRELAFLSSLSGRGHHPMAIAYSDTATFVRVVESAREIRGGDSFWGLKLSREERTGRGISEVSVGGYSADELAELRARRILLGEDAPVHRDTSWSTRELNQGMLNHAIEGFGSPFPIKHSPLPVLYGEQGQDRETFLAFARLYLVAFLVLSNTVEHIFLLDLAFEPGGRLRVDFEGQRRRVYVNTPPTTLRVSGVWGELTSSG